MHFSLLPKLTTVYIWNIEYLSPVSGSQEVSGATWQVFCDTERQEAPCSEPVEVLMCGSVYWIFYNSIKIITKMLQLHVHRCT